MPELPEVETTRRGVAPHVVGQQVQSALVRRADLRYPVPPDLARRISNRTVRAVERRGKYLLFRFDRGTMIVHLGMSGSLRIVPCSTAAGPHDHVDIAFPGGRCMRLRDPRRFGAILWAAGDPLEHRLLAHLGVEPLSHAFSGEYLFNKSRGRRAAIKVFIMDSRIVTGVGNLYANEALYLSGIDPRRAAGRVTRQACGRLVAAIKDVLERAIEQGGTTLRDFYGGDGTPGYFHLHLCVYGRAAAPCATCGTPIKRIVLGQRATYYCPRCQK